jgi:tRNA threonylcarbamoyladenosine biosynthesis protein TsaB
MKLLAIDTTTDACSVALQDGETVTELHRVEPRAHTRILLPMIRQLLGDCGCELAELDAIVLGNGPGSFIGMRISASVAQGLCFGAGLPLLPLSSLAAIAAELMQTGVSDKVAVAQDARMGEVYFAAFCADNQGLPAAQHAEIIVAAGRRELLQGSGWTAAGGGWQRYPQLAAASGSLVVNFSEVVHPRARYLLTGAARALQDGKAIDAAALQPAYLRQNVAHPALAVTGDSLPGLRAQSD